jgi:hypothetical protein
MMNRHQFGFGLSAKAFQTTAERQRDIDVRRVALAQIYMSFCGMNRELANTTVD